MPCSRERADATTVEVQIKIAFESHLKKPSLLCFFNRSKYRNISNVQYAQEGISPRCFEPDIFPVIIMEQCF